MADNLFQGLPPPSSESLIQPPAPLSPPPPAATKATSRPLPPAPLKSALKSSLKRSNPPNPIPPPSSATTTAAESEAAPPKRIRFKTSVDATVTQVIEAMHKISSHIKTPSKFGKASKLAVQLIQAGSVKPGTSDDFFGILEAAMASPSACSDAALRADYQALFNAVQDVTECFNKHQKNQITTWTIRAVLANDLYTDDSFVFAKAAGKIKEAISSLPSATAEDDKDEAEVLAMSKTEAVDMTNQSDDATPSAPSPRSNQEVSDPFGLDALISSTTKKDEKSREKEAAAIKRKEEEEESKRFIKSQREALLLCLETAARRYRIPWAQTVIDILAKHAVDHIDRFTSLQRDAIEKLWASIKEQHIRRKQGKSVTGKLDMNGFEWLQEKYSNEKISIRKAVGGGGDRRAQQWLG